MTAILEVIYQNVISLFTKQHQIHALIYEYTCAYKQESAVEQSWIITLLVRGLATQIAQSIIWTEIWLYYIINEIIATCTGFIKLKVNTFNSWVTFQWSSWCSEIYLVWSTLFLNILVSLLVTINYNQKLIIPAYFNL